MLIDQGESNWLRCERCRGEDENCRRLHDTVTRTDWSLCRDCAADIGDDVPRATVAYRW